MRSGSTTVAASQPQAFGSGAGGLYCAFMVNALKPLTYLLDIQFSPQAEATFRRFACGTYSYVDDFEEGPGCSRLLENHDASLEHTRPVYRCRIWGIRKHRPKESGLPISRYAVLATRAKMLLACRVDRDDGWLRCAVDRVDKHGRLIVRLFDLAGNALTSTFFHPEFSRLFSAFHVSPCAPSSALASFAAPASPRYYRPGFRPPVPLPPGLRGQS